MKTNSGFYTSAKIYLHNAQARTDLLRHQPEDPNGNDLPGPRTHNNHQ